MSRKLFAFAVISILLFEAQGPNAATPSPPPQPFIFVQDLDRLVAVAVERVADRRLGREPLELPHLMRLDDAAEPRNRLLRLAEPDGRVPHRSARDVPVVPRENCRMVFEEAQDAPLLPRDAELVLEALRGRCRDVNVPCLAWCRRMVAPSRCRSGVRQENECAHADE